MRLYLTPVGFPVRVDGIAVLRRTIRDILKGLAFLHELGYIHRDLRWANVIQEGDGNVRLIDLERVGKTGTWTPENGVSTKSGDIEMLYHMMMIYDSMIQEDEEAVAFIEGLGETNSAEEVLLHPWLSK